MNDCVVRYLGTAFTVTRCVRASSVTHVSASPDTERTKIDFVVSSAMNNSVRILRADPAPMDTYGSSFVLPITRDGFALLAKEERVKSGVKETKLALLGGKALPQEDAFQCASREAIEETGGALSDVTRLRLARGAGVRAVAEYCGPQQGPNARSMGTAHDLVVPADRDVDQRFDAEEAERLRALSVTSRATTAVARPSIGKKPSERQVHYSAARARIRAAPRSPQPQVAGRAHVCLPALRSGCQAHESM